MAKPPTNYRKTGKPFRTDFDLAAYLSRMAARRERLRRFDLQVTEKKQYKEVYQIIRDFFFVKGRQYPKGKGVFWRLSQIYNYLRQTAKEIFVERIASLIIQRLCELGILILVGKKRYAVGKPFPESWAML